MKKWLLTPLIALLFSLTVSGCVIVSDDEDTSLTVYNDSSYVLTELYVTTVDNPNWGPDMLGTTVLYPGESITVYVACDYWDIQIVDELGAVCEVYDYYLCFDNDAWSITDGWLAACGW